MIYRISLASNPRIIPVFLIILALPAAGVAAVIFLGVFWGIVASAGALFLDYHLIRYTVNVLKSRVSTSQEGVRCVTPAKEEIFLPWNGLGDTGKLWENLLNCVKTRQQPACSIDIAVRVQAPLSMGVISLRESKVVKFDPTNQSLVLS